MLTHYFCNHQLIYRNNFFNMKKIFSIFLFILCSKANSVEWLEHERGKNFISYIDISSISVSGKNKNFVTLWVKYEYMDTRPGVEESNGKKYDMMLARDIINCQTSSFATVAKYYYDKNLTSPVGGWQENNNITYNYYIPGTYGEYLYDFACKLFKKEQKK